MKTIGIKDKTFYYSNKVILGTEFVFNFDIDKNKLNAAYKNTIEKHPYFKVRPVFKGHVIYYEMNNSSIPLINKTQLNELKIGTDDTNGFPYAFYLEKNKLMFLIAHALTDYCGMTVFLNTLIGFLAKEYGYEKGDELIKDLNYQNDDDCFNPYKVYKKENANKTIIPNLDNSHLVSNIEDLTKCESVEFDIDSKEFIQYFKNNNNSFVPCLVDVISTAIDKTIGDGYIHPLAIINANARSIFGSNCLTNFSESVLLPSRNCDKDLSPRERMANLKTILKSQLEKENIQYLINENTKLVNDIENNNTQNKHERIIPTYALSYVGKDIYSGLYGFIKSYRAFPVLSSSPIIYIIVIAREKMINIQMHFSGNIKNYAEAIKDEMKTRGISSTNITQDEFPKAVLAINEFKRV